VQIVNHTRQLNILLVEDDEVDVMNVRRSFKKQNIQHRLDVACDGVEALRYLRSNLQSKPHVILLDINMPRMNGLEFLEVLREDPELSNLTVFVMTTSGNVADKAVAYRHNVAGYIIKPLSSDDFGNALYKLTRFFEICEFP
jgi:CheY-like chemotaxis protein